MKFIKNFRIVSPAALKGSESREFDTPGLQNISFAHRKKSPKKVFFSKTLLNFKVLMRNHRIILQCSPLFDVEMEARHEMKFTFIPQTNSREGQVKSPVSSTTLHQKKCNCTLVKSLPPQETTISE